VRSTLTDLPCLTGLASEVLLGRYELPAPKLKDSRLARHEASVWQEARETMLSLDQNSHRDQAFNAHILPRCRALIEASGHRMAYEAAAACDSITPEALALFESGCVMSDLSWYCEYDGASRKELFARDVDAAKAVFPQLKSLLDQTKAAPWASTPLLDGEDWDSFVQRLPVFETADVAPARQPLAPTAEPNSERAMPVAIDSKFSTHYDQENLPDNRKSFEYESSNLRTSTRVMTGEIRA
jgi:acyl-CoA oxidase